MNGVFQVTSGKVHITDPCYDIETSESYGMYNVTAQNGEWAGVAEIENDGVWGQRVKSAIVYHRDYTHCYNAFMKPAPIKFAVDSGQIGVFDVSIYVKDNADEYDFKNPTTFYEHAAHATLETPFLSDSVMDAGFCTSTGYGDGCYCAELGYDGGELIAVRFFFIEEDEEDEMFPEDEEDEELRIVFEDEEDRALVWNT